MSSLSTRAAQSSFRRSSSSPIKQGIVPGDACSLAHMGAGAAATKSTTTGLFASILVAMDVADAATNTHFGDLQLAFWISAFAVSHIAMSAIRRTLIQQAGQVASALGVVGNEQWSRLPSFWPGDGVGKDHIFPDQETAGRQLYRAGYTLVSFTTLGNALWCYLQSPSIINAQSAMSTSASHVLPLVLQQHQQGQEPWLLMFMFATAVAANAASLTSLVNASPLGLVPSFQVPSDVNGSSTGSEKKQNAMVERNDSLKFQVRGLTRITRHPLILPVVPWGIANAVLAGGKASDWFFFGGLAVYALAGCAAQDLRVLRQEGSVGTVFSEQEQGDSLQQFFESTSFFPFGSVLDGRQSIQDIVQEVPWLAAAMGSIVGYVIEDTMLNWLMQT